MIKNTLISENKSRYRFTSKYLENVKISENKHVGSGNYLMSIISTNIVDGFSYPKAGQFYMLQLKNQIHILRRPISLHSVNHKTGKLEFLYKVLGKGTEELSSLVEGDIINIQGPLGKGFDIIENSENIIIVGGGIGLAPLKQLVEELIKKNGNKKITFIAGGRDKNVIQLLKNFNLDDEKIKMIICTDDGSVGEKSNVIEILKKNLNDNKNIDIIYSCGPHKVLEIINEIANKKNIISQISMEERMACGVGACVGCSIETNEGMKKVCYDGPVFYSSIFKKTEKSRGEIND